MTINNFQAMSVVSSAPKYNRYRALPRTLTKNAIKTVLQIRSATQFKKVITTAIIEKMGLSKSEHDRIREYNIHQTEILIQELRLEPEELMEMGKLM